MILNDPQTHFAEEATKTYLIILHDGLSIVSKLSLKCLEYNSYGEKLNPFYN